MTLASSIQSDATTVFLQTDDFAETVTYHAHQGMGASAPFGRSISANVVREAAAELGDGGEPVILPTWTITVANNSTDGISSDELDVGGDQIAIAPRVGETAVRKSIIRLISHDAGMVVVEVR